ncbi:flagellar hook-basal body protein [Alkalibacillus haloalkaliphilus]|uniref:Flagellar hook-basal body complex protein FlhO n=1 Tax=Alkalibacillus haloalkaliphilus TaxID=94136 RepID=A0A511W0L6_9BACI|nr:flagellar hook-basal body protein [Alkalibacillus haloalkaliphilus]GEN44251.1 flagellar hook-basal body complex protein FlhO [Alkalibacillus haloalkaliphilus]
MLRGFNTAGAGMIANQRHQDSLSNNMSNALTPGFKQDRSTFRAFPEMLIQNVENRNIPTENGLNLPRNQIVGSINSGTYLQEDVPLFEQGDVRETSMPTDVALQNGNLPDETGFLFFEVANEDGDVRYTRNGNFTVDAEGFLTTNEGYYVLNEDGEPIQTGSEAFEVTENGEVISAFDQTLLGIGYHPNANDFVKEGENLFNNDGEDAVVDAREAAGADFQVRQNHLEWSNVDTQATMADMTRAHRMFEMNQQVVRTFDQSMELAANEIGRLR